MRSKREIAEAYASGFFRDLGADRLIDKNGEYVGEEDLTLLFEQALREAAGMPVPRREEDREQWVRQCFLAVLPYYLGPLIYDKMGRPGTLAARIDSAQAVALACAEVKFQDKVCDPQDEA